MATQFKKRANNHADTRLTMVVIHVQRKRNSEEQTQIAIAKKHYNEWLLLKQKKCHQVCLFLTTSSEGLPSDAIPIAGRIHPPQRLQRHTPVKHPISLPLGRC
jgi:hypothetical protein